MNVEMELNCQECGLTVMPTDDWRCGPSGIIWHYPACFAKDLAEEGGEATRPVDPLSQPSTSASVAQDYESTYDRDWRSIIEPDGRLDWDTLKRELHDFSFLMQQASEVYCEVTGNRLSKTNYFASAVISVYNEQLDELIDEAIKEAATDAGGTERENPVDEYIHSLPDATAACEAVRHVTVGMRPCPAYGGGTHRCSFNGPHLRHVCGCGDEWRNDYAAPDVGTEVPRSERQPLRNRVREAAIKRAVRRLKEQGAATIQAAQVAEGVDAALNEMHGPLTRLAQQELDHTDSVPEAGTPSDPTRYRDALHAIRLTCLSAAAPDDAAVVRHVYTVACEALSIPVTSVEDSGERSVCSPDDPDCDGTCHRREAEREGVVPRDALVDLTNEVGGFLDGVRSSRQLSEAYKRAANDVEAPPALAGRSSQGSSARSSEASGLTDGRSPASATYPGVDLEEEAFKALVGNTFLSNEAAGSAARAVAARVRAIPSAETPSWPQRRILWNDAERTEIDEFVVMNPQSVHVEQMGDENWWMCVTLPDGRDFHVNFFAVSKKRMTLKEQSCDWDWDQDITHEDSRTSQGTPS